jgi:phosphatidylinositol alpha-1,6-mannosyltransferase
VSPVRVLVVTNDFPPRVGGIQTYLHELYARLDPSSVVVLAPAQPGDAAFDRAQPFEVVRWPGRIYWPTPELARRVRDLAWARRVDALAFGAVLPMNLVAEGLDLPLVVHTHGFEVAWAHLPVLRQLLRRIARRAALVTAVSEYTRRHIGRALRGLADGGVGRPRIGPRVELLRTGVDLDRFHPAVDGAEVRKRYGLGGAPVVVHASRLVRRKGQDTLLRALPLVRREVPDARALVVGAGPDAARLRRLARELGLEGAVRFAGEVDAASLPEHYAAGDVFAMPCRSRWAGLEVEGLGLVYLEAQACARPAVAGDSGGAPEAVVPGETGYVVPGRDHRALARCLAGLLGDPERARAMGRAGRAFVEAHHRWDDVAARYRAMLDRL